MGFRLVYIPASVLSHTGHGLPWLTTLAGWLVTFGGEWLVRRRRGAPPAQERPRALVVVLLALVLLGLFPEEAPIGLILWAGVGVAWGVWAWRGPALPTRGRPAAAWMAGALLGVTGLYGPGSWLAALLLASLFVTER